MKKRIARGCAKRGSAHVVGHVLAECLQQCDLDEIHADGVAHEIGHLAAGNPGGDLDDGDAAVGRGDELRERDGVRRPSARTDSTATCPARRSCSGGIDGG